MRHTPEHDAHGTPAGGAPDGATTPAARLDVLAEEYQLLLREMLDAAIDQLAWNSAEDVVGLTTREHLTLVGRLPRPLASRLEAVAHRIGAVPQVADRYRAGVLTFDQLAAFIRLTARCHGPRLEQLDTQAAGLADELSEQARLHDFTDETELLFEQSRVPAHVERQERRAMDGRRLIRQQDFDGGGIILAELDPVGFATANAAIDAGADALQAAADREGAPREPSLQRLRVDGLVLLAETFLAGGSGDEQGAPPRAARPTITVQIDLGDATPARFASVCSRAGGGRIPTLTARLTDTLAGDAELLVQLRDGARPLAELRAKDTPEAVRRAVLARDGGCRFGGCNAPPSAVHVHHINGRDGDDRHDPDELVGLCGQHHLRHVHRHGWKPDLDPHSGMVTWKRRGSKTFTTMPRHRRPRPRAPDELPSWAAPPRPPPPGDPPGREVAPSHWTTRPADLHAALSAPPV